MRKTVNVNIGGSPFTINEDAYFKLDMYLKSFRSKMGMGIHGAEVMEDLELRIAEILSEKLQNNHQIVNLEMVNMVIAQLGMPDGSEVDTSYGEQVYQYKNGTRKFFRDPDNSFLGGVCSGTALYFNIDSTVIRILTVIFAFPTPLVLLYIILWLIVPMAKTPAEKCLLRGLPLTPENLRLFTYSN